MPRVLDTSGPSEKPKGPSYRKINTYFKSTKQYWKERNRRKKVRQLSKEHYTYKQIAEKLGISVKTVQRDMKKIRRYVIGQINRYFRLLEEERHRKLNRELEGKNAIEQLKILTRRMIAYQSRQAIRKYRRHYMIVKIDMRDMVYGIPRITTSTRRATITYPFNIRFHVVTDEFETDIGGFRIG